MICSKCKQNKDISRFSKRNTKFGYRRDCKDCHSARTLNDYHTKSSHKEAHRKASRKSYLKKYGLTEEKFDSIYNSQGGLCKICGVKILKISNRKSESLAVDHCHKTGFVRGFLCHQCNLGLGQFKDSVQTLQNAIKYLENANSL